jgi:opine dehydrogenase
MKCCIIGAGSGGRAFAAYLSSKGHIVNIYNRSYHRIADIRKYGGIEAEGKLKGFFSVNMATQSMEKAVKGSKMIFVVTPASAHKYIARQLAPFLENGQLIILNPGRTFGSSEFLNIIQQRKGICPIAVCETQTLLFTSRALESNRVKIHKIKKNVKIAAFPDKHIDKYDEILRDIFPQFESCDDYLEVTLYNVGMFLHPTISLLNAGPLDNGMDLKFYSEGASKRVCQVLEKLEFEINQVYKQLGLKQFRFTRWAQQCYGVDSIHERIHECLQNLSIYQKIDAPKTLMTRYFTEDVPTGLVPFSSLANFFGISVPTIDSNIHLSNILCGIDFYKEGRTLSKLGLTGYITEQFRVRQGL